MLIPKGGGTADLTHEEMFDRRFLVYGIVLKFIAVMHTFKNDELK